MLLKININDPETFFGLAVESQSSRPADTGLPTLLALFNIVIVGLEINC